MSASFFLLPKNSETFFMLNFVTDLLCSLFWNLIIYSLLSIYISLAPPLNVNVLKSLSLYIKQNKINELSDHLSLSPASIFVFPSNHERID